MQVMQMQIALESPIQPEAIAMVAELDAYQHKLYPPESVYALDLGSVAQEQMLFAAARNNAGTMVGCGAIVLQPGYGELKRMYVSPGQRGLGIARKILAYLEELATQHGCTELKLETGPRQLEALGLYASWGYQRCGPYGEYPDDPWSVFMRKSLNPTNLPQR
jgi:putative acetyltransferase